MFIIHRMAIPQSMQLHIILIKKRGEKYEKGNINSYLRSHDDISYSVYCDCS